MNIPRRRFIHLAGSAAALLVASRVGAQTYPTRPVRVIVPFAPGGPADIVARLLTQKLGDHLARQFYVENVAGAGGNLGMRAAARAAPDGYTLALVSSSFMVNPSLYPHVPYDLSFASAGMGTTPYLSGELFKLSLGADLVHVPFNGSAPAIQSTLGGHTQFAFVVLAPAVPHIKEGSLRGLAVLSAERSSALPDVPTIAEAGFRGQEADTLLGVLVPAGTPREIIDLLHREIVRIVALPDVKARLDAIGFVPVANTPDEFAAVIKAESERWAKVIRAANIKAEL